MGAWDSDPFGNDNACDWVYEAEQATDLSFIAKTIENIHEQAGDDLEGAEEAIAAADTLARLKGKFYVRNAYTESIDEWVAKHPITPPQGLLDSAIRAIDRILTPPSEPLEIWKNSTEFAKWKKHLTDLQDRLR
jgi:hypothetical protein